MAAEMQRWIRERILRSFGKQRRRPVDLATLVEGIMDGQCIRLDNKVLMLPDSWEDQFQSWIDQAGHLGQAQRQHVLKALLALFRSCSSRGKSQGDVGADVVEIRRLCHRLESPAVKSFVLGSLGACLLSHGLPQLSCELSREAADAARRGGATRAALQWAVNVAVLEASGDARQADRTLRALLLEARNTADEEQVGIILNNLACINEQSLGNLDDAVRFQEEAVAISRRSGDRATEQHRVIHLGHLQEQAGQIVSAMASYDRGLSLDSEIGLSEIGFRFLRHMAELASKQYEESSRETLASHITVRPGSLSEADLQALMEQSKMGEIMSSWDPDKGAVSFVPDYAFASMLCTRGEWKALAVYAQQWMEQGFMAGDGGGFHWLAVAFRALGYPGAADEAVHVAMSLPRAMAGRPKPEDHRTDADSTS